MIWIILLSISSVFVLVVGFLSLRWAIDKDAGYAWYIASCVGMIFLTVIVGWNDVINPSPTAIDVYRGNTELQITYKGSVPVDTVVIFKGE